MSENGIHRQPVTIKLSMTQIIQVDLLDPDSIHQALKQLDNEPRCQVASNQLQAAARDFAELSNRAFTLGGALWCRGRAMHHQGRGDFAASTDHVAQYMKDLKELGVV